MNRSISNKVLPTVLLALLLLLVVNTQLCAEEPSKTALSAEVEQLIENKMKRVQSLFVGEQVLSAVRDTNDKNKNLTSEEIAALDSKWRSAQGVDSFIQPFLSSSCAKALRAFQQQDESFAEIFLTDKQGLNVCQTNKTSDYYQADEGWWQETFLQGKGKSHHGQVEYDDSAGTRAVALYFPIKDPESEEVIGVAKAVVDLLILKTQ